MKKQTKVTNSDRTYAIFACFYQVRGWKVTLSTEIHQKTKISLKIAYFLKNKQTKVVKLANIWNSLTIRGWKVS
jgi:hypothetical protein